MLVASCCGNPDPAPYDMLGLAWVMLICGVLLGIGALALARGLRHDDIPFWRRKIVVLPFVLALANVALGLWLHSLYQAYLVALLSVHNIEQETVLIPLDQRLNAASFLGVLALILSFGLLAGGFYAYLARD